MRNNSVTNILLLLILFTLIYIAVITTGIYQTTNKIYQMDSTASTGSGGKKGGPKTINLEFENASIAASDSSHGPIRPPRLELQFTSSDSSHRPTKPPKKLSITVAESNN